MHKCEAFERVCNFSSLTVLLYDNGDKCLSVLQWLTSIISHACISNKHFQFSHTTSVDFLNNTGQQLKQPGIYPCGNDRKYFPTISAGHKGIMKGLTAPQRPFARGMKPVLISKLQIVPVEPMQWWRSRGREGGGSFTLYSLSFLSFFNPQKYLLCYIESQKKDWKENLFLFSFF